MEVDILPHPMTATATGSTHPPLTCPCDDGQEEEYLCSAILVTQFYLQITPCLPFLRKRSPDGSTPKWGGRHQIAAYSPNGWKAELSWLVDL